MKKNLKKGFTLVELVIVIAVIGILAAILIPTFTNLTDSAKETAALSEARTELTNYTAAMSLDDKEAEDELLFVVDDDYYFVYADGELTVAGDSFELSDYATIDLSEDLDSCSDSVKVYGLA